jgi:hypothetical protein
MNWKTHPYYEMYQITPTGEVKDTRTGKIRKPHLARGYLRVNLRVNNAYKFEFIHALVAETYIGLRPEGLVVNHIDGNKVNNCVHNLEFVTYSENLKHAYRTGLKSNVGEKHSQAIFSNNQVKEIKRMISLGIKNVKIAEQFGVGPTVISHIKRGHTWATIGK